MGTNVSKKSLNLKIVPTRAVCCLHYYVIVHSNLLQSRFNVYHIWDVTFECNGRNIECTMLISSAAKHQHNLTLSQSR
jgi:hypothetical protein